ARIALRTQQVIAEETGVTDTIDPLGGSYFIESLTDQLEAKARAEIERIDSMGGMIAAIDTGYPQREIERAAYDYQRAIEREETCVVGVNKYVEDEAVEAAVFRVDPELEKQQIDEIRQRRAQRNQSEVDDALSRLGEASKTDENLFPLILEAVRVRTSIGEICSTLADTFGRYRDHTAR
ncbi:MAG TPA: methylmalonyl-CoA mutase, partial [Chromatiales bacterium]|nr:methylmalonyl-CoA mutase [Chromatiales bacterium]